MLLPATLNIEDDNCVLIECSGCMDPTTGARGRMATVEVGGRGVFAGVLCEACVEKARGAKKR